MLSTGRGANNQISTESGWHNMASLELAGPFIVRAWGKKWQKTGALNKASPKCRQR